MAKPTVKLRDAILWALEKAVDGAVGFADFYDNPRRFVWFGPRDIPKSNLSVAISRLRKKGFIEKVHDEGKILLRLTQTGRDWILKHREDEDQHQDQDGVWRIVVFSIFQKSTER